VAAGFFGAKVSAVAFPALVGCASHKQLNLAVQFLCSEGQNPVWLATRYFASSSFDGKSKITQESCQAWSRLIPKFAMIQGGDLYI